MKNKYLSHSRSRNKLYIMTEWIIFNLVLIWTLWDLKAGREFIKVHISPNTGYVILKGEDSNQVMRLAVTPRWQGIFQRWRKRYNKNLVVKPKYKWDSLENIKEIFE